MTDYKLVPVEPTLAMIGAAKDAYMPFGDMDMAIRMALLTAPDVQDEPVGEAGSLPGAKGFTTAVFDSKKVPEGTKLYTTTQPVEQQAILNLSEAARSLGVAQVKDDQDAIDYWSAEVARFERECKGFRTTLAESQANDRQVMYYLNQVREIVGGDDLPDMVERCRELVK